MRLDGLHSEMQTMMLQASNQQTQPTANSVNSNFGDLLGQAINNVNGLQKRHRLYKLVLTKAT